MPDSTAEALASINTNLATIAAQNAEAAARRAECVVSMRGYQHDAASVDQARHYASCVDTVYGSGEPLSASVVLFLKALFLFTVIGGCAGAWKMWKPDRSLEASAAGLAVGAFYGAIGIAGLWGLGLGFWFVFTR